MENAEYQPQHGISVPPEHDGRRLTPFDTAPGWEDIPASSRIEFKAGVLVAMSKFPQELKDLIQDIQVVGSQAHRTAHAGSDIDLVFVVDDAHRDEWYEKTSGKNRSVNCQEAQVAILELSNRLGVKISWSIGPDAKPTTDQPYLVCYSFNDNTIYGRELGEIRESRDRYNTTTRRHEPVEYKQRQFFGG